MFPTLMRCVAAGMWPALPATGYFLLALNRKRVPIEGLPAFGAACAMGLAVWTPILVLAAMAGAFHPPLLGLLGWMVTAYVLGRRSPRLERPSATSAALFVVIVAAATFLFLYPREELLGGRDNAVYANQALALARLGTLAIPSSLPQGWLGDFVPGFYLLGGKIVGQFGKFLVVWLAQAFASFGIGGLVHLNGVLACLGALCFFGACLEVVAPPMACFAAALYLFSPGPLWVARTTLSETGTALFLWAALWLLLRARKREDRALAFWGGGLLGAAGFARIDALLLPPVLLAYLSLFDRDSRTMRIAAGAAFSWAGIALAHYLVLTLPYVRELPVETSGIAIAALVSALLFAARSRLPARVCRQDLFFFVVVQALIAAIAVCRLTPLVRELVANNSAIFLGLALAGWLVAIRERVALPVAALVAAFGTLYFFHPSVNLLHFYAMRRYVPVLLPGMIFFVALALERAKAIAGWVPVVAAAVCIAVAVAETDRQFAMAEYRAPYEQVRNVASKLPDSRVFVEDTSRNRWLTPLAVGLGKPLVPLDLESDGGTTTLREALEHRPVYFLYSEGVGLDGLRVSYPYRGVISGRALATNPLDSPIQLEEDRFELKLARVDGFAGERSHLGQQVGIHPLWDVHELGFHAPEQVEGRWVRWTAGEGFVFVPLRREESPKAMHIELLVGNPDGSRLTLSADGKILFEGWVGPGVFRQTFRIGHERRDEIAIGIKSDIFVPAEKIFGSGDHRNLGVAVRDLRLLDKMPASPDEPLLGVKLPPTAINLAAPVDRVGEELGG